MSTGFGLYTDIPKEKLYGLSQKQKQQAQEQKQQEVQVRQDPSQTGFQWTQAPQAQAAVQTTQVEKADSQNVQNQTSRPQIALPNLEDTAMLSSAVRTKVDEVHALQHIGQKIFSRCGINLTALKEKFKEYYMKSKSHNLLLERFMANVKMSGLNALMSLAGVSPSEIEEIKSQVRAEALAEIDSKLTQDWAYAKAMIEIMG